MILADASVWIDHFRRANPILAQLFERREILTHPFVIGEIAMGGLKDRQLVLRQLGRLPKAIVAGVAEVAAMIEWDKLYGTGIGYVDAHLIAATRLTPDARLWTRDRRLRAQAERLGIASAL